MWRETKKYAGNDGSLGASRYKEMAQALPKNALKVCQVGDGLEINTPSFWGIECG